jgi:hypothetical protein
MLVGLFGERLEGGDVLRGAGGSQQRRAETARLGDDELERDALDRHAQCAPFVLVDQRDHLRELGESRKRRPRIGRRYDD